MKISEVIKKLKELKKAYGDMDCGVEVMPDGCCLSTGLYDVERISVSSVWDGFEEDAEVKGKLNIKTKHMIQIKNY